MSKVSISTYYFILTVVQVLEIIRYLLDPESMTQPVEKSEFLDVFYMEYIGKLISAICPTSEHTENGEVSLKREV